MPTVHIYRRVRTKCSKGPFSASFIRPIQNSEEYHFCSLARGQWRGNLSQGLLASSTLLSSPPESQHLIISDISLTSTRHLQCSQGERSRAEAVRGCHNRSPSGSGVVWRGSVCSELLIEASFSPLAPLLVRYRHKLKPFPAWKELVKPCRRFTEEKEC